jgi:hypothetical protein
MKPITSLPHKLELTSDSDAAMGEIVAISIGPEKKLFRVHKDLICHHSEYFRTAYNGQWKESESGVALEDVETEVFKIFLHWLYAQDLPDTLRDLSLISGVGDGQLSQLSLIQACVFGDRFLAPRFKQHAHNMYVDLNPNELPYYNNIKYAFQHLNEGDPLLTFFVDLQCIFWSPTFDSDDEVNDRALLPVEFLVRVMLRFQELKKSPVAEADVDYCFHHVHGSNKERTACPLNKKKSKVQK